MHHIFRIRYFWPTYLLLLPQIFVLSLIVIPASGLILAVTGLWIIIGLVSPLAMWLMAVLVTFFPVHLLFGLNSGRGWPTGQIILIDLIAFDIVFFIINFFIAKKLRAKHLEMNR